MKKPPNRQTRRNIYMPDALWRAMQKAALQASRKQGRPVSVAELVRDALSENFRPRGHE